MILEIGKKSALCDTFVIVSAPSNVRVKAIVDHIEETLKKPEHGFRAFHKEGYHDASWVLLDYGDVIAHVFYHETRRFYDLENLWGDAPKRNFTPS